MHRRLPGSEFFAAAYQASSFYCANPAGNGGSTTSKLVPRGTAFHAPWTKNIDLGAQFNLPGALRRSSIRLDVFNVLNSKAKVDFVEFGENDDGSLRSDYGFVSGYQAPRSARITWSLRLGRR